MLRGTRHLGLAAWLGTLAAGAAAHDTWFAPLPAARAGELRLALGTGNRWPALETSVSGAPPQAPACRGASGATRPLKPVADRPDALVLAANLAAPATCWAELPAHEITLPPDKVALYLDEIRAPQAVRAAWQAQQARGQPWHERYTKHARIEHGAGVPGTTPLGLELVPAGPLPAAGGELAFVLQRGGQPVPAQAVELVSGTTGLGFWLQTNAQGQARVRVPLPGAWLLRGTLLEPDPARAGGWQSHFFTLAFNVAASGPRLDP